METYREPDELHQGVEHVHLRQRRRAWGGRTNTGCPCRSYLSMASRQLPLRTWSAEKAVETQCENTFPRLIPPRTDGNFVPEDVHLQLSNVVKKQTEKKWESRTCVPSQKEIEHRRELDVHHACSWRRKTGSHPPSSFATWLALVSNDAVKHYTPLNTYIMPSYLAKRQRPAYRQTVSQPQKM